MGRRWRWRAFGLTMALVVSWSLDATAEGADRNRYGLDRAARNELKRTGLGRYVGDFKPIGRGEEVESEFGGVWKKYTFDTEAGDGPICIAGTPFSVFHQARSPTRLIIVLDGGGACVQDSYQCALTADTVPPRPGGILGDSFLGVGNPLADWSKMFVSYCDGSEFSGDNDVVDPNFPFGEIRYHRGIRNLTAAFDLARKLHPDASQVLISGISAGGYAANRFAPSVYRMIFRASAELFVLSDAGPGLANPDLGTIARDMDWHFARFYPPSCKACSTLPGSDSAAFLKWTLEHDAGYKGALFSTDADATIRIFASIPTVEAFRELLLRTTDPVHESYPHRFKRFIMSESEEHAATSSYRYYAFRADGMPLYEWIADFVEGGPDWVDIVEDFVPAPAPEPEVE